MSAIVRSSTRSMRRTIKCQPKYMSTIALTKKTFILFLLFFSIHSCYSQARWIFHPTADPKAYGVYHFRKQFVLAVKPRQFIVRISGDDRYELFVNGKRLSAGPARGDVAHWRYETRGNTGLGPRYPASLVCGSREERMAAVSSRPIPVGR